jgi:glycosyltransferase involved in cell wall biosynthesis
MIRSPEPLVSVVTPFFNTEDYLSECIESVQKQSYRNWEYLLVNNRSTDRSLEIAESYARRDSRIRVLTNSSFVNQVQNYNGALRSISDDSSYCKIVQADDWMFPDCLQEMVTVAESHPSVGIVGAYRLDNVRVNCDGLPYPSTVVPGRDLCRLSLLDGLFVFGSPSTIMYRSDIVRSRTPFFKEGSRHEDTEACYEILQQYDFGFVHKVLTFTRRENESIMSRVRQFDPHFLQDKYIVLLKYGHFYLSDSEYEDCKRNLENHYYQFLGKGMWSKSRKNLLEYHTKGLKDIGHSLSSFKLFEYAILELIDFILDIKRSSRYFYNFIKNNGERS